MIRRKRNHYSHCVVDMILLPKRPVVVHVTPWYLPHIGGLERHVEAISNHIGGFDSVILTPRLPGTSRIDRLSERVTIVRFGPTKFPAERGRTRSISSQEWLLRLSRLWNLRRTLSRDSFDVLHVHRPPLIELAYLASKDRTHGALRNIARRWNRLPSKGRTQILTDHGLFVQPSSPSSLNLKWFMEWVLEEYDHVICVDPSGYRRAKSIQASDPGRFEKVKIHHMPQPIDTNLFHSEPLPVGPELRVGYSGRWERDGMFLLRELVSMNLPGVRYCISGGATPRDLHEYAHAFNSPGVELRPNIIDSVELAQFYHGIHVLVDFYRGDGCGRSVLEAMACGRTILRTRSEDTHPVVDRVTGLLLDPNAASAAQAIRQLAENPQRLVEIGRRAREAVLREYSNEIVVPQIERLYREGLSARR